MRWVVATIVSGGAWAVALGVMAFTEVGPVVALLTPRHGLHEGDVLALGSAAAVTAGAFGLAWASGRRSATPSTAGSTTAAPGPGRH